MPTAPNSDQLLSFVRNTVFAGLVDTATARAQTMLDVAAEILVAFDLTTATGDRLDKLGTILQLAREPGMSDARYRVLLQIQVELILSSKGTPGTIMRIVELFSESAPTSYAEHYPLGFEVGALLVDSADAHALLALLVKAKAAAYMLELSVDFDDGSLFLDNATGNLAGAGTLDSATGSLGGGALAGAYQG